MELHISLAGRGDRATRIYAQIRAAILDGRLRADERLPPTRELAERLRVARNTVAVAYDRLTAEGFLHSRVGAGTFVSAPPAAPRARRAPAGGGVRPLPRWRTPPLTLRAHQPGLRFDFSVGVPDARLFPWDVWRRLLGQVVRPSSVRGAGYRDPAGHPELRAAIARHLGVSRSVRTSAEDVLVTQGAQQALDLIGRILIEPGTRVAVEEPGYPPARALFRSHGAKVSGVAVDAEGLVVDRIPAGTRLVYTTPSHQFPLGSTMSLPRRAALLAWAARHDAVIIEDDYDSEFRFADRPLEPLQSLDSAGRVIYVGSLSKTLLPALRLGFLVAPRSLLPALCWARQLGDWHGDLLAQAALARFIDEGLLARHVRRATREYAARRTLIIDALGRELAEDLDLVASSAGLHVCALIRPHATFTAARVVAGAAEAGVVVEDLAVYRDNDTGPTGLVLGYGAIGAEDIPAGLAGLTEVVRAS